MEPASGSFDIDICFSNNEHTEKMCHIGLLDEILTYCYAKNVSQETSDPLEDKSKPNAVFACPECKYFAVTARPKTESLEEIKDKTWAELQKDRILKQSQSSRRDDGETTIWLWFEAEGFNR